MTWDDDIVNAERDWLKDEIMRLRNAIREQAACRGHDLCWYKPELYRLLPEGEQINKDVPPWPEFMQRCAIFRGTLDDKK